MQAGDSRYTRLTILEDALKELKQENIQLRAQIVLAQTALHLTDDDIKTLKAAARKILEVDQ